MKGEFSERKGQDLSLLHLRKQEELAKNRGGKDAATCRDRGRQEQKQRIMGDNHWYYFLFHMLLLHCVMSTS